MRRGRGALGCDVEEGCEAEARAGEAGVTRWDAIGLALVVVVPLGFAIDRIIKQLDSIIALLRARSD